MSGLLADIFVAGDRAKKRVRGLLDPQTYQNAMDYSTFEPLTQQQLVDGLLGLGMTKWAKVPIKSFGNWSNIEGANDFLYHVTSKPQAEAIIKEGLKPRIGSGMFNHGVYDSHSKGKAFLTERDGVSFWADKVEQQLFDKFDNPPPVSILRIPRTELQKQNIEMFKDEIGSEDAKAVSWYITQLLRGL